MAAIAQKVKKIGTTLWDHKKKTAFAGFLLYLGANAADKWNTNRKIRKAYALQAVKFGEQHISAEERPRRLVVLANVTANERHCYDDFVKNALPLFHNAGIRVDIIKAESEKQLEQLAAAVDETEADAVYVVGGDGTLGKVVTGIFRNREKPALPLGAFPGGYDNLTLGLLVPSVFRVSSDVRRMCESAMAVIEEQKRTITPFELQIDEQPLEGGPLYGIGDVGAGWFRHIEDRRRTLWWFGGLKRRWAYIWEMIKRSPEKFSIDVEFEDFCSGCNRCRQPIVYEAPPWRWWHVLTGPPRYKQPEPQRDYSNVVNENCGRVQHSTVKGCDLLLENEQFEDVSRLRLRVGGADIGRFGVMADGQSRCGADVVGSSPNADFYQTDVVAGTVAMKLNQLPMFIRKLYVSSNELKDEELEGRTVRVKSTNKKIDVYLPQTLRIALDTL